MPARKPSPKTAQAVPGSGSPRIGSSPASLPDMGMPSPWTGPMNINTYTALGSQPQAERCLEVTQESETGRNEAFRNRNTQEEMNRAEAVQDIRHDLLPGYHVRVINGVDTPVSNPNRSEIDNLG
jgi:hypothetical protein